MGLRETFNENPRLTTGITAGIIVVVLAFILWPTGGAREGGATAGSGNKVYFSDDDGKTWFAEDVMKIPPFDHGGKPAVRARVFQCDGKKFVNHMERYTPDAQKKMQEIYAKGKIMNDPTIMEQIQHTGMEVKAPADKGWTKLSDMNNAQRIIQPKCPGGAGSPEEINP